jgi:hypothetical protein
MMYVSILVELLRSHPRKVFWLAVLTQSALWWITPSLFYSAPPGDVALVLAIGHEFQLGTHLGPPLAFWLGEIAFGLGGMPGVYLLSQICVVVTFWAVFRLGCEIAGLSHAVIAAILMTGVFVFNVATPEFGPTVLAMPISALMILHFWHAIGEGRRSAWLALSLETGLLLMTTYAGVMLCLSFALFTAATQRGRQTLGSVDPWIAAIVVVVLMFPHLLWLDAANNLWEPALRRLLSAEAADANWFELLRIAVRILVIHGGLIILFALGSGWRLKVRERVPVFIRSPVDPFARRYITFIAIVPLLVASIIAVIVGERRPLGGIAPLVVASALAIVVASGDAIHLYRQRLVGLMWGLLMALPPAATAATIVFMPWITADEYLVTQPARVMSQFFQENFTRRTGKPLEILAGDPSLTALVAVHTNPRASIYFDQAPVQSPWITPQDLRDKGAIVLWVATDTAGTPPASIRQRFPDLVAEVPRAFERTVQGRAPLLRVGWGVLRPAR